MITREVQVDVLHMTVTIVDAPQAHTLVALPHGHAMATDDMMTTKTIIGDEAEVALLTTADEIMLPTEFEHGPAQTNPTIMAMSGGEVLSVVESARMKIRNGDVVLVLQNASRTQSAHATVLLRLTPVFPSRNSLIPLMTVLRNWPPCSLVPQLWRWNGSSG